VRQKDKYKYQQVRKAAKDQTYTWLGTRGNRGRHGTGKAGKRDRVIAALRKLSTKKWLVGESEKNSCDIAGGGRDVRGLGNGGEGRGRQVKPL